MGRGVLLAALLGVLLPLGGCERAMSARPPAFQLTDITGAPFGRDFSLTDHTGQRRSLADYRGKVVALMFGYLHCPDMCPTTLLELKQVLQGLGPAASGVQVLFVTLDPERDTAASLASGVARFDPTRDASGDALYHAADAALYRAKAAGRNQVQVAGED